MSFEICNGGRYNDHDEIVFDSKECPLCQAKKEIEDLEIKLRSCIEGEEETD